MISEKDAEPLLIEEWHKWRKNNIPDNNAAKGIDALLFYGDLRFQRSDLFDFRCNGSKWQTIHEWLRRNRLVAD
jgi:hypothetical protein